MCEGETESGRSQASYSRSHSKQKLLGLEPELSITKLFPVVRHRLVRESVLGQGPGEACLPARPSFLLL